MTARPREAGAAPPPPRPELDHLIGQMRAEAELFDPAALLARYRAAGLDVDPDPFSPAVADAIRAALSARRPHSAIRIGDGEASFLALGADPATPALDRFAIEQTMALFQDRFRPEAAALGAARDDMRAAVAAADTVGVVGLWLPRRVAAAQRMARQIEALPTRIRGISGHWRAIRHMAGLAGDGALAGKAIRSAHFYLGLVPRLPRLMEAAEGTLCLTSRPEAVARLRASAPDHRIDLIALRDAPLPEAELPRAARAFLDPVRARLPDDLSGRLVLIGAGAWSETYCTCVRERGGVAVDLGSGFDLLAGRAVRPVHRAVLATRNLTLEAYLAGGLTPEG